MAYFKYLYRPSAILGGFLLIVLSTAITVSALEVTLCEDKNFNRNSGSGTCAKFQVCEAGCINLKSMSNRVSSINTRGGCVKIWKDPNCQGASKKLQPDDTNCDHSDLSRCTEGLGHSWDNVLSSISGCCYYDEPQQMTTTTPRPDYGNDKGIGNSTSKTPEIPATVPIIPGVMSEENTRMLQVVQSLIEISVSLKEQNVIRKRQMEIIEAEHLLNQELLSLRIAYYKDLATQVPQSEDCNTP